jgi:hypothetical protein
LGLRYTTECKPEGLQVVCVCVLGGGEGGGVGGGWVGGGWGGGWGGRVCVGGGGVRDQLGMALHRIALRRADRNSEKSVRT